MMKKLFFGGLLSVVVLGTVVFSLPTKSYAINVLSGPCGKDSSAASSAVCTDNAPAGANPIFGPSGILTVAIKVLSLIVGILAIIFIIIQGIRIALSGGDAQSVASARSGLVYALIGLIVAAMAQALVAFVLNRVQ